MTVGQELLNARRNLGLSLEELASKTCCSIELLRSIEETDLRRLPPASVLESATRAYAAAVHLDADELSHRYLAQVPILPNTTEALTAFEPEADAHSQGAGSGLFVSEPDPWIPSAELAPSVHWSRPQHSATTRDYRLPIAALLIVSAMAVGVGYLVGATGSRWGNPSAAAGARVATASDSAAQRPDQAVEHAVAQGTEPAAPVHADNSAVTTTDEALDTAPTSRSRNTAARGKEPGAGKRAAPATGSANRAAPFDDAAVPSAVITVPGTVPLSAPRAKTLPATGDEVSGSWDVIAHDESSTPDAATNRVRYYLQLAQRGTRIAGSGYRVSDDGPGATSSQQAVAVTGTLSGQRLTLDFAGQAREHFVLYRADDGVFRGRFRRDSTPSGGSSIVTLAPREQARQDPD
jgi:cytoskeletal protein RodZ